MSKRSLVNMMRAGGIPAILLALSLSMTGCETNEGPVEEAGEEIDQVMDEAADEAEQAADEVEEAVQ